MSVWPYHMQRSQNLKLMANHTHLNGAALTQFLSDCGIDSPNVCRN